MTRRVRIIQEFRIDYIAGEDAKYPGHQLVCAEFADRIRAFADARRRMTFRQAEEAFALAAPEYCAIIGHRGQRVRGRGRMTRWRADKFMHSLMSYVEHTVPPAYSLPRTGNRSLAEAMANAFGCGWREVELAWSRRAARPKRAVKR